MWLTAEETLKFCMGDHEELAVLLCCFFLHLGVDACVVLGPGALAPRCVPPVGVALRGWWQTVAAAGL